uniref:Cation/H+ exchanger transmembrane domain-containing protein n=1 Tax=Pyramimonas obovata TaxID=1411642 RepID=A0A7S0MRY4_9CHLO|mmetsp:Transcript_12031/g.25301  ORF Transcript_12031/g.25301 Transcript_12031/m.25301 type:complete len:444 (+) Transcript_12031:171-1502(+)
MPVLFFLLLPTVLLISHQIGQICGRFGLPAITGYLITGVISGPWVFGLLSERGLLSFKAVDKLCLACVALSAGSEMHLQEIRKTIVAVGTIAMFISISSWIFVCAAVMLLESQVEFMQGMSWKEQLCVASMAGTIMVTRSPATAIAVLKEVDGRGPFCSLTLNVVILKDIVVIILYALNLEGVKFAEKGLDATNEPHFAVLKAIAHPFYAVICSILLGATWGFAFMPIVRAGRQSLHIPAFLLDPRMKCIATLLMATGCFYSALLASWEPLLACVIMGLYAANAKDTPNPQADREALEHVLRSLMPLINVTFFTLIGASLNLGAIAKTLHIAVCIVVVRLVALMVGAGLGSKVAGCPPTQVQVAWLAYVTQAGVALGLIKSLAEHEPVWGPPFASLMTAVVVCNCLVGPPMFKYAIIKVGEAHRGVGSERPAVEGKTPPGVTP